MTEPWGFGQLDALWSDPDPATPEGKRLWSLFRDGKLGPSPWGIRDFGQRVCQIEAEATAAAEQRLAGLREALTQIERDAGWLHDNVPDYSPDGVATLRDICREIAKAAHRALSDTPPPASPRQGEPVDVEQVARLRRDFVAVAEQRNEAQAELLRLRNAQIVARYWLDEIMASDALRQTGMSHPVAMVLAALDGETDPVQMGIPSEEYARRRAALSEPAEAGEPVIQEEK